MYYCKNCGEAYQTEEAIICVKCGTAKRKGRKYCHHCGAAVQSKAKACSKCGVATGVKADVYSVLSLIMGVFAFLITCVTFFPLFPGSAGIILALVSWKQNGKSKMAIAALILSSLVVGYALWDIWHELWLLEHVQYMD